MGVILKNAKIGFFCFILLFCFLNEESFSEINVGSVISHSVNEIIPYNWFSYIPTSLSKAENNFILVVVYGGLFDYSSNTEQVKSYAYQITSRAEKYRLILLLPSIPRSENPAYYTMAFDRYSFLSTTPNFYKRPAGKRKKGSSIKPMLKGSKRRYRSGDQKSEAAATAVKSCQVAGQRFLWMRHLPYQGAWAWR